MGDVRVYRSTTTVNAEVVTISGPVHTNTGTTHANEGDYLVYGNYGVYIITAGDFEDQYAEIKGDSEYSPAGHTVDQVMEFLRENPDQVDRIKKLESLGGKRKGILEF